MQELIETYKNIQATFDTQSVLREIHDIFVSGKKIIIEANDIDAALNGQKIEFDTFINVIDNFSSKKVLFKNQIDERHIITSIGIIGINIEDYSPYAVLEMAIATILSHNAAVINLQDNKNETLNNFIITVLNQYVSLAFKAGHFFKVINLVQDNFFSLRAVKKFYSVKYDSDFDIHKSYSTLIFDLKARKYVRFSLNKFFCKRIIRL